MSWTKAPPKSTPCSEHWSTGRSSSISPVSTRLSGIGVSGPSGCGSSSGCSWKAGRKKCS
ncbi:hypothetical protein [Kitasatospora purpeofusca]|uniref:hypothetical protein n=1 Tax=Kitasatospora purpeofusca TaxID=67352 RepID=UPI003658F45B